MSWKFNPFTGHLDFVRDPEIDENTFEFKSNIETSVDLDSGTFVNIYIDGGIPKLRKSDMTVTFPSNRAADGFVKVGGTAGDIVTVHFMGINEALSGLVIGQMYFISTDGLITGTPPTTAGYILQPIGKAISTTSLYFERADPVIRG